MTDIAERLRAAADESAERWADMTEHNDSKAFHRDSRKAGARERLEREAADEVESLRAERDRYRGALESIYESGAYPEAAMARDALKGDQT